MLRIVRSLANSRGQVWFNGTLTAVWLAAIVPTLVLPQLRGSILYVALLSVWALFATHLGAWIAAMVNVKAERIDDRTGEALHFSRIEAADAHRDTILAALEQAARDRAAADIQRDAILTHLQAAAEDRVRIAAALTQDTP
jgi:hypothetical protein